MKRLLLIIFLGLILSGCFDQTEKLIERCADVRFEKMGYKFEEDPLNLFIGEKPAKEKLEDYRYDKSWRVCEDQSTKYPKKFKAQFKD